MSELPDSIMPLDLLMRICSERPDIKARFEELVRCSASARDIDLAVRGMLDSPEAISPVEASLSLHPTHVPAKPNPPRSGWLTNKQRQERRQSVLAAKEGAHMHRLLCVATAPRAGSHAKTSRAPPSGVPGASVESIDPHLGGVVSMLA